MNIIVCCKQILDPEIIPVSIKFDPEKYQISVVPDIHPVISPFDEHALEAALRIKDQLGGKITAIFLGNNLVRSVIKKTLALGADELILMEDDSFEGGDSWSTALALSMAIQKIGEYDLVLCGRQAADWDSGQVGLGVAEILGIPCVSMAKKIEVMDGKARAERVISDGYEIIEMPLPAVVTVSNEIGAVRHASVKGMMAASRKNPIIWKAADVGADPSEVGISGRFTKILDVFQPVREGECEIIDGESPEEAGIRLAEKLREEKII